MNNNTRTSPITGVVITTILVALLLVSFYFLGDDSSWFSINQLIGIIAAAAISGVITVLLLIEQSNTQKQMLNQQEETRKEMLEEQRKKDLAKDKDVKIYSNKIAAFSAFNREVWTKDLDNSEKTPEIIENIRKQLYSRVILYLNASEIKEIISFIPDNKANNFPVVLAGIINVLNRNAEKNIVEKEDNEQYDKDYHQACQALWEKFNEWSGEFEEAQDIVLTSNGTSRSLKKLQAWHFCEWSTLQLDKLDNGFNELSLIEYGEYWRTGLVKQVKKGDLVFLFRGAKKYSGAFIAKGWRVFEYDENRNVTEITSDGIPPVLPVGQVNSLNDSAIQEIVKEYDIYESFKNNNSTSCANVVIDERLCYLREGVENPGGTYRKTISRYYEGYAVKLLEAFKAAKPENASIIDSRCFEQ